MKNYRQQDVAEYILDHAVPVTICVPVYNGAEYLNACFDSLVKQTFGNFVVLVVDNASTDDTPSICAEVRDRRFFYSRNEKNVGSIGNHNICLDLTQTEFVKLFSADDVLLENTLAEQLQAARENPQVGLITCNLRETDAGLASVREVSYLPGRLPGRSVIEVCVAKVQNLIGGPSNTLLRMDAVRQTRFDKSLHWLADLEFHCRILEKSDYLNIDKPGFLYRRHNATDSVVGCPPHIRVRDERAFVASFDGGVGSYVRIIWRQLRDRLRQRA